MKCLENNITKKLTIFIHIFAQLERVIITHNLM